MTLQEAQAQLITVNAAIADLIAGKKLTQLQVGSGNFQRFYRYAEITLDSLKEYRNELLAIIDSYSQSSPTPTFKYNTTIPLVVSKGIF